MDKHRKGWIKMKKQTYANDTECWEANVVPGEVISQIKVNNTETTLTASLTPKVAALNTILKIQGTENAVKSATSTAIHVGNGCTLTIEGVNGTADKLKAEGGKNDGTIQDWRPNRNDTSKNPAAICISYADCRYYFSESGRSENIQPDNEIKLEVRLEDETEWLSIEEMAQLFLRKLCEVCRVWNLDCVRTSLPVKKARNYFVYSHSKISDSDERKDGVAGIASTVGIGRRLQRRCFHR